MSAAAPEKSPYKLNIPQEAARLQEKEAGKPLTMSLETAQASLTVAKDAAEGKTSPAHVEKLAEAVAQDLRVTGEPITGENIVHAKKSLEKPGESPANIQEALQKLPNFTEILSTLDTIEKTYATPDVQRKLKRAGAVMAGMEVVDGLGQVAWQAFLDKVIGSNDQLAVFSDLLNTWQQRKTGEFNKNNFLKAVASKTAGVWGPIALSIVSDQVGVMANKDINNALEQVGNKINQRITESLFLQKYALVQDIPPAEILDIIERGKMATIDLILTMRADVYPSMTKILSTLMPAYQINPIATGIGLTRLWPLYEVGKRQIKSTLLERGSMHTQAEQIDSKIASLLTNLEVAKASGKSADVATQLQQAMAERESLYTSQRMKKITRERWEQIVNFIYDKAAPTVVTALDFLNAHHQLVDPLIAEAIMRDVNLHEGNMDWNNPGAVMAVGNQADYAKGFSRKLSSARIQALVHAGVKAQEYQSIQYGMAAEASRLASLYANNIMPDLQDIREMEALLGSWNELDRPDGPKEKVRKPVSTLPNLDISIQHLNVMGILNDVSFDIKQGEFVAIRADKGEGKTTLLRTILGLYIPDSGAVTYGGTNIDDIKKFGSESLIGKFGYAPQNAGFIDTMSLKENLLLWNQTIPDEKVTTTMKELGLEKLIPRLSETGSRFSGGEKRLLTIVRALLTDPKILYLDEPTANLDQNSIDRLIATLQAVRKNHPDTTIITVTHDAEFAKNTDRTIHLAALNKKPPQASAEVPTLTDHQVLEAIAKP